jgi:acyl-CoA synthetase (NDP forming)
VNLERLFFPESLALIGASNNPSKWGFRILKNILNGGYQGNIYPVNPKGEEILGIQAVKRVIDIPDKIDVALICVPAGKTCEAIKDCARKRAKFAVVIPAGYKETGEKGRAEENLLVEAANSGGVRLIGPNTMGIMSTHAYLYAYMSAARPFPGGVAFVSQSGNLGTQILGKGEKEGIGFSYFVSSGNEADLKSEDFIHFFGRDKKSRVILAYIEGLSDGRRFLEIAKEVTTQKPLIVYKAGRTPAGARAASSHSGAMASSDIVCRSAFAQAGIIGASNTEELLDFAKAFSRLPLPKGNRVAILTWGGGWGVVASDVCQEMGLEVPALPSSALKKLNRLLPSYWPQSNPVDLVGTLELDRHLECLKALASENAFDAILTLGTITGFSDFRQHDEKFMNGLLELINEYQKPILAVKLFEEYQSEYLIKNGSLLYSSPEHAIKALAMLCKYVRYKNRVG